MNDDVVMKDMDKSLRYVTEKITPVFKKIASEWDLIPVEGNSNEICKLLDMSCGVDYLMRSEKHDFVYGIASRVQYGTNYRTFTVRKERESGALTEFNKRVQAISIGAIYPHYTMQSYIVNDNVAGLAIIKTSDLMDFIKQGYAVQRCTNADKIGQAWFFVCKWDSIKQYGYKVFEFNGSDKS